MQLAPGLALAVLLPASTALAQSDQDQSQAAANVRVYVDDDHITVFSPAAGAQVPSGDWLIDVNASADALSGASVDVVTEASPTAIRELRAAGGVGATYQVNRTSNVRARVSGSHEGDYRSVGVELGGVVELAQRNTTLDIGYSVFSDRAGTVVDDTVSRPRSLNRLTATLTQILDRNTYVDVTGEVIRRAGYLGSTYRTVFIVDPLSSALMRVPEETPRRRWSGAGRLRVRRALGSWFVHLAYRYYRDDWSVDSHTANLRLIKPVNERLQLSAHLRGYLQSAADFYREEYTLGPGGEVPELRSRERRLGRMRTVFGTLTADAALTRRTDRRWVVALSAMRFYFLDFRPQSQRDALALTVGFRSPL